MAPREAGRARCWALTMCASWWAAALQHHGVGAPRPLLPGAACGRPGGAAGLSWNELFQVNVAQAALPLHRARLLAAAGLRATPVTDQVRAFQEQVDKLGRLQVHSAASRPSRSSRLTPMASSTQSTWKACRRRRRWPSRSMCGPSTRPSPSASGVCCCGSRPCSPSQPPSTPRCSSCAWCAKTPTQTLIRDMLLSVSTFNWPYGSGQCLRRAGHATAGSAHLKGHGCFGLMQGSQAEDLGFSPQTPIF